MPSTESAQPTSHILPERLFKVAARGETFLDQEVQHLKNCVFCQERFDQFVRQKRKPFGIEPPPEKSV
jgi:hypothetical protein